MSSSASKLHRCPHECGCAYGSKKPSDIKRHTGTRHWACNPECPFHEPFISQVVTPDGVARKRRNQPAVQERNERPTVHEPTIPNQQSGSVMAISKRRVANSSDEESYSNRERSDSNDADPPPSHTKPDRSRMTGRSQNPFGKERSTRSVFDTPHRRMMQKATELSLKPSSSKRVATPSQLMVLSPSPTPPAAPTKSTPPHVTDDVTAADPSPSPGPEPSQNRTPTKCPPIQSTRNSTEPNIESLYASPSPEKTVTELVPIDLDSDQDFEMTDRMLASHRGPLSQSQPIKTEPTAQSSVLSQAKGPLKRQRSHSSPNKSSQAPTRSPQANPRSTKRLRVNKSHSPNSTTVLNDRRKHPEFWDLDGTVILQVDTILFRVMRSTLSKASPWFRHLFSEGLDHLEIMAGCPVYTIEEDFSHLDFANLLRGLENGLEYALKQPHYLRIASIFRAASILEFDTLRRWSLGCLEKQWPADLPPPSKQSKFGNEIPWAEETLAIAEQLDVPQLIKRAYWELFTRPEFRRVDAEIYDDEAEEIMLTRPRLLRPVLMNLTRLRERLLPEWTRITRTPPIDIPCPRATKAPSTSTSVTQPTPCSIDYASWHRIISKVEVDDMTIDDRRMDPISALEVMITEIDWEKEGGFCTDCVNAWRVIWTKDREKIWRNLGDWLDMDVATES